MSKNSNVVKGGLVGVLGLAVAFCFALFIFMNNNDQTERSVLSCAGGDTEVVFNQGWYFKPTCGVETWPNEVTIDLVDYAIQFNGGGNATVDAVARFSLPDNEPEMLKVHRDFGSVGNLKAKLLTKILEETLYQSAGLLSSDQMFGTQRAQFRALTMDMVDYGLVQTLVVDGDVVIRKLENGKNARVEASPLIGYGIKRSYLTVNKPDFEQATREQIGNKREAEMAQILAQAATERAEQETLQAAAEGEKAVVEAEFEQKRIAQVAIQEAEREAKVAVINAERIKEVNALALEAATIDVETAAQEAQAEIERAQGVATAKKLKVEADNYTLEKLEVIKFVAKVNADAYAKRAVPSTIMIMGGDGQGANLDMQTQAFMTSNLVKSLNAINVDLKTK